MMYEMSNRAYLRNNFIAAGAGGFGGVKLLDMIKEDLINSGLINASDLMFLTDHPYLIAMVGGAITLTLAYNHFIHPNPKTGKTVLGGVPLDFKMNAETASQHKVSKFLGAAAFPIVYGMLSHYLPEVAKFAQDYQGFDKLMYGLVAVAGWNLGPSFVKEGGITPQVKQSWQSHFQKRTQDYHGKKTLQTITAATGLGLSQCFEYASSLKGLLFTLLAGIVSWVIGGYLYQPLKNWAKEQTHEPS